MAVEKKPTTTDLPGSGSPRDVSDADVCAAIASLVDAASPECKRALADATACLALDPSDVALAGLGLIQTVMPLRTVAVSAAYEYSEDGSRTDKIRGMYITCASFGGKIRVLIEGADEQSFRGLRRGTRVRLIAPEVRVSVAQGGRTATMYVSAAGIELVR